MKKLQLSTVSGVIAAALFSTAALAGEQVTLNVAAFANYDQVVRLITPDFEKQYPAASLYKELIGGGKPPSIVLSKETEDYLNKLS